jgi:pimeloyl-ACP methyl ester carboxylesterase
LWLAQRRPHRVRSITLFEPALFDVLDVGQGHADHDAVARFAASQIAAVEAGDIDGAAQAFMTYWNGREAWGRLPEAQRARVAASMPTMADAWRQIWRRDTDLPALARLAAPIRLLHGTRTAPATLAVIEALRRVLPRATHRSVAGAGHMGPITHADEVTRLVLAALYDAAPAQRAVALPLAA